MSNLGLHCLLRPGYPNTLSNYGNTDVSTNPLLTVSFDSWETLQTVIGKWCKPRSDTVFRVYTFCIKYRKFYKTKKSSNTNYPHTTLLENRLIQKVVVEDST